MNISERLTQWMTETGMTAVLRADGRDVSQPVTFDGWMFRDGQARASVVFGPYAESVHASGVRVTVDGAEDETKFGSTLALPAGQTYRYTLAVGVS